MKPLYLVRFIQQDRCYIPKAYRNLSWAMKLAADFKEYGWSGAEVIDATDIDISQWEVVCSYGL